MYCHAPPKASMSFAMCLQVPLALATHLHVRVGWMSPHVVDYNPCTFMHPHVLSSIGNKQVSVLGFAMSALTMSSATSTTMLEPCQQFFHANTTPVSCTCQFLIHKNHRHVTRGKSHLSFMYFILFKWNLEFLNKINVYFIYFLVSYFYALIKEVTTP